MYCWCGVTSRDEMTLLCLCYMLNLAGGGVLAAFQTACQPVQVQARMQRGRAAGQASPPTSGTESGFPAAGVMAGQLGGHAMDVDSPSPRLGLVGAGGMIPPSLPGGRLGFRSIGGGFGGGRGTTGTGLGAAHQAPRRQRHKVSSKDLTEEQRIERR